MTTAERIKQRRIELNLSQEEVAKRCGLKNRTSIAKIEASSQSVTLKNIEKMANALDCSVLYLMGAESEKPPDESPPEGTSVNEPTEIIKALQGIQAEIKQLRTQMNQIQQELDVISSTKTKEAKLWLKSREGKGGK